MRKSDGPSGSDPFFVVKMPFPRIQPHFVPSGLEGKLFFRSENHVFVCPQPRPRFEIHSYGSSVDQIYAAEFIDYKEFEETDGRKWTTYFAAFGDHCWTRAMQLSNKPTESLCDVSEMQKPEPFHVRIIERKHFESLCHFAKKACTAINFLSTPSTSVYFGNIDIVSGADRNANPLGHNVILLNRWRENGTTIVSARREISIGPK